uniref:Uncharacterized protein n=1 Tax=Rhizophora mucronata TaxID=61149 RepID=A0A2P2QUB0_RHIMU
MDLNTNVTKRESSSCLLSHKRRNENKHKWECSNIKNTYGPKFNWCWLQNPLLCSIVS